jgi:CheY-like chemotaxis protein
MKSLSWEKKKILVAEDEETNFLFIEAILEDTKVELFWAKNGTDAVAIFTRQNDIDLILMDIKMPEMDGITATKRIRETNKTVPIIAQTAYAMSEDKTKCLNAGCDDYLTKPINHKVLLSTIEKYLNKNHA